MKIIMEKWVYITLILLLIGSCSSVIPDIDSKTVRRVFTSSVMNDVGGDDAVISASDVMLFFEKYDIKTSNTSVVECLTHDGSKEDRIDTCLVKKCLDPEDVFRLSGMEKKSGEREITMLSTILLHLLENGNCLEPLQNETTAEHVHTRPSSAEAWGYSFLSVTIISFSCLTGLLAMPFIHGLVYQKVLIYMVGLAVGTLAGSSLLFLIPEALELTGDKYTWKCLVVISSILMFFNVEWILKLAREFKEKRAAKRLHGHVESSNTTGSRLGSGAHMDISSFHLGHPLERQEAELENGLLASHTLEQELEVSAASTSVTLREQSVEEDPKSPKRKSHGHSHGGEIEPVAWMIIFGDALHNFIDGVSIGAAFTESTLAGVSVSVAILCEELPHELGDFAILLKAGMKIKQAVIYNFLSACTCYIGLIIGVFLGENEDAHTWVFAFAAGMFLYIALVDMMPEMTNVAEQEDLALGQKVIFLLQNLGMISGFGIMLILAIFGGNLEEAIQGH